MFTFEEIALTQLNKVNQVKLFLQPFHLSYEADIDYTLAVFDGDVMIATASKSKNVLKCFAVLEDYRGQNLTSALVKRIEDRMFKESLYHFFIFTSTNNRERFLSIGYKEIISAYDITILENGKGSIRSFLENLKLEAKLGNEPKIAIVMNGNPFTNGHRYLIEQAAKEGTSVVVFVVSEESSTFPFSVRYRLIKEGVKDLANVTVLETGPYLISNATFPTYFLKENTDVLTLQTSLDCLIFSHYYKEIFNITVRYIGEEPYCETTRLYNQQMKTILPDHGIIVKEIKRKILGDQFISASIVRNLLFHRDFESIKAFVPPVTLRYLSSEEAKPILQNLKENKRH